VSACIKWYLEEVHSKEGEVIFSGKTAHASTYNLITLVLGPRENPGI